MILIPLIGMLLASKTTIEAQNILSPYDLFCNCKSGTSPPVCVTYGETWDNYCGNLEYCLKLAKREKIHDGPCNQMVALLRRLNPIIGTCTCTPGSSPPVCVSSHETWDSYCDNLEQCMELRNVYKLHDGPCVIKNITKAKTLKGPCAVVPGSFPDICVDSPKGAMTWSSYYPSLDYCLELYETYKLHDGPCFEDNHKVSMSIRSFKQSCVCDPGSSPAVCVSSHETWDNYCDRLIVCMKKKKVFLLHDGPCVIKDLKKARKNKHSCNCPQGSSPPVCVGNDKGHETWDNYCDDLEYCLEKRGFGQLLEGSCDIIFRSHLPVVDFLDDLVSPIIV